MTTQNVPIIGDVFEQKLIITFKKDDRGEGCLNFDFDPPIIEVVSPEQHAAVSVADHIIRLTQVNITSTKEKTNGKIII